MTGASSDGWLLVQLLMVVLTYAPLFWAIRHVPSGLTAVLDLALMPVSLLGFGIALAARKAGASAALRRSASALPASPSCSARRSWRRPILLGLLGAAAIVFSAVVYSLGSVIARPLTKATNAAFLSGLTLLPGGLGADARRPGA